MPYYGKSSVDFAKQLVQLIENKFTVKIRVVFTTCKVRSFFKLKSPTRSTLFSNVVYQFTCAAKAHITYIGYTSRHLLTRAEEHTSKNTKSHVRKHISECAGCNNANVGFNDLKVLKHYSDEMECKLGEALAIKKFRPILNKQLFAQGSSLILNIWN